MKKQRMLVTVLCVVLVAAATATIVYAKTGTVKLNKTSVTLTEGQKTTLKLRNTKKTPAWKSSKKSVATVSKKGKVTAKKAGTATITAILGKKSYKCKVTVTKAAGTTENPLSNQTENEDAPVVYFTSDISSGGLMKAYNALDWNPTGKVAVKVSTGESNKSNYLRGELIADLVKSVDGTIVECMTAYGGNRAEVAMAKQAAADHGFTAFADFDLMDEDDAVEIPYANGTRVNRAIVGSHIDNYDDFLILSHFKGHAMAGLGGAIKNVAIGMSTREGKAYVHTGGVSTDVSRTFSGEQTAFLEALPETVQAVENYVGKEHIVYVSVMNRLSVDCDCDGNPEEPDMHDIGILASYDPVALDQACVDLVYAAPDGASLIKRMESRNGIHAIEHGEEIGLGSRTYQLKTLD